MNDTLRHRLRPLKQHGHNGQDRVDLYMDPAGEYNSEEWSQYLQSENIRASMIAAEAHWQNGRCEVHGRIIKDMLTRMDRECPVETVDDFERNLLPLRTLSAASTDSRQSNVFWANPEH